MPVFRVDGTGYNGQLIQFAGCREDDYSYGDVTGGTWTLALLREWASGDTSRPLPDDLHRALQSAHCAMEASPIRHLLVDLGQWERHHLPSLENTTWQAGFSPELEDEARRLVDLAATELPGDERRRDRTASGASDKRTASYLHSRYLRTNRNGELTPVAKVAANKKTHPTQVEPDASFVQYPLCLCCSASWLPFGLA